MNTYIFYSDFGYYLSLTHKTDASLKRPAGKEPRKPTAGSFVTTISLIFNVIHASIMFILPQN